MSQTVIISLGNGDFEEIGFTNVRVTLNDDNGKLIKDCGISQLPPAPEIPRIYTKLQSVYRALLENDSTLSAQDDDDWPESIEPGGVTNFSEQDFQDLTNQLERHFSEWLKTEPFRNQINDLTAHFNRNDEILFIFEITDFQFQMLGRLPWQTWKLFEQYPKAGIALSQPGSERTEKVAVDREKIRILAILSDAPDVDNEEEKRSLESLPDDKVETKFVDNLSREDFNNLLWDKDGWDILFFSGHSKTEGQQGRIYINNNKKHNSLTIEELKEALQTAINKGLQLAIFNSCDGLGLASSLAKLNIPAVIVMKEEVPNVIAQQFFCKFLTNFREQDNLYLAERKTKEWLRGWENKYPGASLLPVICQNKAVEILRWSQLQLVNQPKLKEETSLTISSKRDSHKDLSEKFKKFEEEALRYLPEDPPQELVNKIAKVSKAIKQTNEGIKRYLQKNLHLPPKRYASFVGRENTINEIMVALKPTNPRRIIAIDGFGGIGKTAITQEIVQRSMKNNDFYFPIWQSAQPQIFTGGGFRKVDSTTVNFDELLTKIASGLGYCEVHQKKTIQEKRQLFREIINEENYLVVIDNLETMEESENLVNDLDGLFEGDSNTKVIITTRKQIGEFSHVRPFALKGLELDESLEFLRVYASERPRANEIITSVDQDKLVTIYERTEGHPLAIELIVGKLEGGFSIDRILVELEKVNFKNCESDETIYHQFYKFILFNSWNQLSELAQFLLMNIGAFNLTAGAKIDDLISVSELTLQELENATSQLIKWSLVKRQGTESQQTFLVHPFTYLFVQELE
jgi:hypothetical protein